MSFRALQRHPRASPVYCLSTVERTAYGRSPVPPPGFLSPSAACTSASSTALFRAATVPGRLPSRFPLPEIGVPLSRPPGHLAVIPRRAERRSRDLVTDGFLRLPRLRLRSARGRPEAALRSVRSVFETRSPGSPADYELPFHRLARGHPLVRRFPVRPGSRATVVAPTVGFTRFAALFPLRVRSRPPGCPERTVDPRFVAPSETHQLNLGVLEPARSAPPPSRSQTFSRPRARAEPSIP